MKYLEIKFKLSSQSEIAADLLREFAGEAGCESFIDEADYILGYAQEDLFNEEVLKENLKNSPMKEVEITYEVRKAEYKNWNEKWEQESFKPIVIGDVCVIHSTQHTEYPQKPIDIKIDPEMSFGSGGHETTSMMLQTIFENDMKDKNILDMGCGTGILSIAASKSGAKSVTAIDIDEWSVKNATKNCILNHSENIEVQKGDYRLITNALDSFDIVLANINKNILLHDLEFYADAMHVGSKLLMSGFYVSDLHDIKVHASKNSCILKEYKEKNNWCCAVFEKRQL